MAPLLLLLLYPTRCFQTLLNQCNSPRVQVLHTFMDSFQGCYRTSRHMDCRYFAALNLMVRIGNLAIFSLTLSRYYYPFVSLMLVGLAGLMALCQPYKSPRQNTVDTVLYLLYAFGYMTGSFYALSPDKFYDKTMIGLSATVVSLSIVYGIVLVLRPTLWKVVRPKVFSLYEKLCCKCYGGDEECWHGREEELINSARSRDQRGGGTRETTPLLIKIDQRRIISY